VLGQAVAVFIVVVIVSSVIVVVPLFAARSSSTSSSLLGRFLVSGPLVAHVQVGLHERFDGSLAGRWSERDFSGFSPGDFREYGMESESDRGAREGTFFKGGD
jgi:hypothetical protein